MQIKKPRRLAIDLTLALIAVTGTVIGTALDNAADFFALCVVYNLAEAKDKIAPETAFEEATTILEEANNLNLSTATDSYFDAADGLYHQGGKVKDQEGLEQWKTKAKAIVKKDQNGQKPYLRLPAHNARNRANKRIHTVLNRSASLIAQYNAAKQTYSEARAGALKSLTDTIYGEGKTTFDKNRFNNDGDVGRDKACGALAAGGDEVGQALADAFICLCTAQGGNAQNECADSLTAQVDSSGDQSSQAGVAWDAIKAKCKETVAPGRLTADTIMAATAQLMARIGASNSDATQANGRWTLGKTNTAACAGAQGTPTMCINFKKQLGTSGGKLPWLEKLHDAATSLTTATRKEGEAAALKQTLMQLNNDARSAYVDAQHEIENPPKVTQLHPQSPDKTTKEEVCNRHQSSEKCNDPCKWNETATDANNKCSLDQAKAAEQQATQTAGTGTGEQTSKCTGLDSKEKCEGVQGTPAPGKKSVCGWITFEDGKGAIEKPYCRDSSLLVNKKLVLITAVFMRLVTFYYFDISDILRNFATLYEIYSHLLNLMKNKKFTW